jgi:3-oxoacyl-[acyl-carrier protein] reductase
MKLTGRVAIVTGAARGLGREIAFVLAREGASLALCDVEPEGLARTESEIVAAGGEALADIVDVGSSAQIAAFFARVEDRFGKVDILVNNAAIIPNSKLDEQRRDQHYAYLTTPVPRRSLGFTSAMSDEEWLRFWDVNVHGVFYCTREALKRMEPRGYGRIVNIASIAGLSAYSAHSPHYSASKGAVVAFTRSVAAEVAGGGIFVNAIAPGGVQTPMFDAFLAKAGAEKVNQLYQLVPAGRLGTMAEYASLAVYLAGDQHYLAGQVISPNGGMF